MLLAPLVEIAVFIQVGRAIGVLPTLALIVLSAVLGVIVIRLQGAGLLNRARDTLRRGEPPVAEAFDGLCLLAAGALLLTPGFVTDALGVLLLLPPLRRLLYRRMGGRLARTGVVRRAAGGADDGAPAGRLGDRPTVIDVEFEEIDDVRPGRPDGPEAAPDPGPPPPGGGWGRRP